MDQRGVAAVEFALLLPVLIMVLFGIIEFGIALSRQQVLDTASREGRVSASVRPYRDRPPRTFERLSAGCLPRQG